MRDINYSMKKLCDRNHDGSFRTQKGRREQLNLIAKELRQMGFKDLKSADQLKPKHVWRLVERWQEKGITPKTIKNRMAAIRWVAEKTNNVSLAAKQNSHYGVPDRQYSTNEDKSVKFTDAQINQIKSAHIQAAARLQREFGLRREESMKIIPTKADEGNRLHLQASWCKGGRERYVPITTDSQREALDQAKLIAGTRSLIPADKSYVQHMRTFEKQMRDVGLGKSHGARHEYAHRRFQELTGKSCPAKGGESVKSRQEEFRIARQKISQELGHEREQITVVYLGR